MQKSFPRYRKANPSYTITSTLPSTVRANSACTLIRITPHAEPVPVSYTEVDCLLPQLYSGRAKYDFVVHTGVDTKTAQYSLETAARCRGYAEPGADGKAGPVKGAHPVFGEGAPEVLRMTARAEDVMARWEKLAPVSNVLDQSRTGHTMREVALGMTVPICGTIILDTDLEA